MCPKISKNLSVQRNHQRDHQRSKNGIQLLKKSRKVQDPRGLLREAITIEKDLQGGFQDPAEFLLLPEVREGFRSLR